MILISLAMTLIVFIITIWSCVSDVRCLRIPNWHSLIIIGAFCVAYLFAPDFFSGLRQHIAAMAAMFAATYIMFILGMVGGGDAKFGTALGLWAGLKGLMPFIFYMTLAGGVLGVIALLLRKRKLFKNPPPGSWVEQAQNGHNAVPYGMAISFGFWMEMIRSGFLHAQVDAFLKLTHL